jgi:Fe-S-cluster containining protein
MNNTANYSEKVQNLMQLPQSICNKCGLCCKLFVFNAGITYEEIQYIADNSQDTYQAAGARKFLSYFLPVSIEEAMAIAPEYTRETLNKFQSSKNLIGFFQCRYVNENTGLCNIYESRLEFCKAYPVPGESVIYHKTCAYKTIGEKNWQEICSILNELNDTAININQQRLQGIEKHEEWKDDIQNHNKHVKLNPPAPPELCIRCGTCCKVAYNNLPYEELKHLAQMGEQVATDFLSVFEPYSDIEEVEKLYPELVQKIKRFSLHEKLTLYYCKFVQDNNLCGIYEKRPSVCKSSPHVAWAIVSQNCGYNGWLFSLKEQVRKLVRSMNEYVYLKELLSDDGMAYNVPIKAIEKMEVYDCPGFTSFQPVFDLNTPRDFNGNLLETQAILIDELHLLIKDKLKFWMKLYLIS